MSDTHAHGPSEVQAIDAQASRLMKRGIRLMQESQPGSVTEALACFDHALELRRGLPHAAHPLLCYGLAACWLNRADALMRLADGASIAEALNSYEHAIALLRVLPLGADPRFPRRLAIANQNRGLALQAQGGSDPTTAIAAFTSAIAILDHNQAARVPDRQYLLAAVWMNLANAHVSTATAEAAVLARIAARRAIDLVADLEATDADAAEVGLKARHVLCQSLARRLSQPAVHGQATTDDVHEATDAVDDGLHLARRWELRGVSRFRGVACDLFRFGVRVYARYQPQFVEEFVLDNSDPDHSSREYVERVCQPAAAMAIGKQEIVGGDVRLATQEALELATRAGR